MSNTSNKEGRSGDPNSLLSIQQRTNARLLRNWAGKIASLLGVKVPEYWNYTMIDTPYAIYDSFASPNMSLRRPVDPTDITVFDSINTIRGWTAEHPNQKPRVIAWADYGFAPRGLIDDLARQVHPIQAEGVYVTNKPLPNKLRPDSQEVSGYVLDMRDLVNNPAGESVKGLQRKFPDGAALMYCFPIVAYSYMEKQQGITTTIQAHEFFQTMIARMCTEFMAPDGTFILQIPIPINLWANYFEEGPSYVQQFTHDLQERLGDNFTVSEPRKSPTREGKPYYLAPGIERSSVPRLDVLTIKRGKVIA